MKRWWIAAGLSTMVLSVAPSAGATDQATCAASLPGIEQASEHMKRWQEEWGLPGESAAADDLSSTYSGPELVAMQDVTAAHEAFVLALDAYASRIAIAEAAIEACAGS